MAEFRWMKMSFSLIAVLQITAAGARHPHNFIARDGDAVTLPCGHARKSGCDGATWFFQGLGNAAKGELSELKTIEQKSKAASDRLSVTANCSLDIKKVTAEDVGLYTCKKHKLSKQQGHGSQVHLSLISMTEHKVGDKVTLNCSVLTCGRRRHTVKWLYGGEDVSEENKEITISWSTCSVNATFMELVKCGVADTYTGKVHSFPFRPILTERDSFSQTVSCWWGYILVAVALVALLVNAVAVLRWTRTTANEDAQMDDNTADPEEGVSYASISYTKKTQVLGKDDGDVVTYSTVKASSSSAGASADPTDLYATVRKPKK